jgi:hypothetical protein
VGHKVLRLAAGTLASESACEWSRISPAELKTLSKPALRNRTTSLECKARMGRRREQDRLANALLQAPCRSFLFSEIVH